MSLFDSLNIGLSGLNAAAAGLQTTDHNVANATVRGYTRRNAEIATATPVRYGLVWFGQGARIDRIGRTADPVALGRLLTTSGDASAASAEHAALVAFETSFEPDLGPSLRDAVDQLFDAFQGATVDPSDPSLRRSVVDAADSFALTVSGIAKGLEAGIAERNATVLDSLAAVNADLAEVAALNAQILSAGGGLAAGDLADRRDQAITRLAEAVGATVYYERDGSATVRIGGHAAVSGSSARSLAVRGGDVLLAVDSGFVDLGGEVGGRFGGELAARGRLQGWLDDLDTLATDLATAINDQLAAGFDANGLPGEPLFTLSASGSAAAGIKVHGAMLDDPMLLAFAASPLGEVGDGGNLAALVALEDAAIVGGTTAGAFASDLVARVASETSAAGARADSTEAMRFDAEELYTSFTGVNLDEEAVRLVQYQAAYQAAAKVVQVADETLDTLMSIVR